MNKNLQYKIALTFIPNIGTIIIKRILKRVGSIEGIFLEKKSNLLKIEGVGPHIINNFNTDDALRKAEKQISFIEKKKIKVLFYLDNNYPQRLLECIDAPILLYYKGDCNFNVSKIISVVGTRNATNYGKTCCENLIREMSQRHKGVLIISGLAYGIDIFAHKAALKYKLPTTAILGHSLAKIYPSLHGKYVKQIIKSKGAILSEFHVGSKFLPSNFIQRNRIIAGMADATIVVESGIKGGALYTAAMANSYNREIFAFPGRKNDNFSIGCNKLIKKNAARLIESVEDLEYILNWKSPTEREKELQKKLLITFSPDEQKIYDSLKKSKSMHIDMLCQENQFSMNRASSLLLKLEFDGIVKSLPGKNYTLV